MGFGLRLPYENVFTRFADTADLDAFGRVKVSEPVSLFDNMSEYGNDAAFWETAVSGGSVAHVPNNCAVRLSTGGTTDAQYAYRQTRQYLRYQPGRSLNIETTFTMSAAVANGRARIGSFDASNGIFFQRSGSAVSIVRRTNVTGTPTDNVVAQADWNADKMDGSGASGVTLDVTKANILFIQMQFLGVGRVQVGFVVDGRPIVCHEFLNANTLSTVYMSTGCLPVRGEVINVGTAGGTLTMDMYCTSVSSGGIGANQKQFSRATAIAGRSTSTTLLPVISIRAATILGGVGSGGSLTNRGHIIPKAVEMLVASANHQYRLVLNATLTGPSWTANGAASIADFDITASAMSGGTVLDQGYLVAAGATRGTGTADLFTIAPLVYTGLGSAQDILTVGIQTLTGSGTANASITWTEEY